MDLAEKFQLNPWPQVGRFFRFFKEVGAWNGKLAALQAKLLKR